MKRLLFGLLLFSGIAYGQYPSVLVDLRNDPDAIELQINDLSQTQVDLGFGFPFYDNTYDKAWVTYTGVINFQDTGVNGYTFCCSGFDLEADQYNTSEWRNGSHAAALSQSIFGLWTDLAVDPNPNPWYKTTSNTATFGWYDIPEYYNLNNLNSFEIKLFDTGDIKFRYDEINIDSHNTTVGTAGDLSAGQYNVLKYKQNGWNKDIPMVLTFNTLTGNFEDQYGDITTLATSSSNVSDYVAIDPCTEDPKSCDIFDPVSNFNPDFDVPGDSIYDFVPDTIFYTPDVYTDQDQFNNDYDAMTQMVDDYGMDEYYDSLPDFDTQQDEFNQQFEEQGYVEPTGGYEEPLPFTEDMQEFFEENFQMESFDDLPGDFEDFPMAGPGMEEEFIEAFEDLTEDIIDVVLEEDIFEEEFIEEDIFEEEFAEVAFTEELFDEEITHEEVVMSKNEENLLVSENTPESVNTAKEQSDSDNTVVQTNAARRIDAVGIAMNQIQETESTLDQSQQISEETVLNEDTYSNQEYSDSSIADNMPLDFQESNTFEVNQPHVDSVDAINYVVSQLQESTTFVETAFVVSNLPEETHMTLSQEIETQETLLEEIETQETLLEELETQELSEFGGVAEITEESIIEELLDQNSGSDNGGMDFSMGDTGQTFRDGQSSFGDDTSFDFSFGGPSVVFTATTIESTTQQSDTQEVIDTSSSTTTTVDQNFDSQTDQAFSTGGSISDALTATAPPDFSRFNVAPPSQQEQQTTQKADAQANNMSEKQLEQNLDEFASNMQDSGGFTDQSLIVFLMGRNSGFSQYAGQLQDVSFYTDRGMPGGKMSNDRNSMLQLIGTNGKHEEMIAEQYK